MLTRDTFCYVPLLSTLKQILEVPSFRQEILRSADHQDNLMYDLSDGCMFKKHAFFKSNPNGLQVIAYYDEVETCNPLGSSSGKFKLGCVFFTLGNIHQCNCIPLGEKNNNNIHSGWGGGGGTPIKFEPT